MRAADLFSGLGGFTAGAEAAGARVLVAANHWPEAVAWHERNHPEVEHLCQDLLDCDWTSFPEVDVVLASPACQGFSECGQPAARRYGARPVAKHQRDRNTAWAVLSCLDTLRPRCAVVENVVPFQRWALFPAWCDVLRAMGYRLTVQTVNGLDHGSAQHRERTIVVAHQDREVHVRPTGQQRRSAGDCLDLGEHPEHRWGRIADKSERMRVRMRKAQSEAGSLCLWNNVSESRGRRLEDPLPTLTTKSGSQLYLLDGERARILNPRELARGQGFPDTYHLPRQRELASKLIGNAIDVRVAEAIVAQAV